MQQDKDCEVRNADGDRGRGLFALKPFNKDDAIFEEVPIVSCQFAWNITCKYIACDYCLRPLETTEQNVRRLSKNQNFELPGEYVDSKLENIVFCERCNVMYCSPSCKESAFQLYHRALCHSGDDGNHPLEQLIEVWKQMHYPPETATIMLLVRILAYIKLSKEPEVAVAKIKNFVHMVANESQELVHKLLGDAFSNQVCMLREMTAAAINGPEIQEFLTPDGFCSLLALIGTNSQGIGTSPLAEWVKGAMKFTKTDHDRQIMNDYIDQIYADVEKESGSFLNTEGSGLYALQSMCNHSCKPNAEVTFPFSNHRMQLKALRDIASDEEILISYLDECCLERSRYSRQKELAQNYLFVCKCEKCLEEADQSDRTTDDDMDSDDEPMDD